MGLRKLKKTREYINLKNKYEVINRIIDSRHNNPIAEKICRDFMLKCRNELRELSNISGISEKRILDSIIDSII